MHILFKEDKPCQFIERCFAASHHCTETTKSGCYQAEIMTKNLKEAKILSCPEAPELKCDCAENRALLNDPKNCLINGKCVVRQVSEVTPRDFRAELFNQPKKVILRGMNLCKSLRSIMA